MRNVVVIPIYKTHPSEEELKSFRQCIRILGKHDLCLICAQSLDDSVYRHILEEAGVTCQVRHFDECFFTSQRGYNKLMLTRAFYQCFSQWDYMLIYQLDAYVFSDKLDEWCSKGYDYIGAPFRKLNKKIDWENCGNGGFSLRHIRRFITLFHYEEKVLTLKGLWRFYRYRGPLHRLPLTILGVFGHHNHISDFLNDPTLNEDLFYAMLADSSLAWRIPDSRTAMHFAFEEGPSELFSHTKQLPFGCHAYLKNEYESFYRPYMDSKEEAAS